MQKNTLKLFLLFIAYFCCFSLGANLDFLDFLPKSFIILIDGCSEPIVAQMHIVTSKTMRNFFQVLNFVGLVATS